MHQAVVGSTGTLGWRSSPLAHDHTPVLGTKGSTGYWAVHTPHLRTSGFLAGAHNDFVILSPKEPSVIEHAIAASAALAGASAAAEPAVNGVTILGWCFTLISINIGVFGFIYSIYATARMNNKSHLAIVGFLVQFCTALAIIIVLLSALSIYVGIKEDVRWEVFAIISCMAIIGLYVFTLAAKMYTPGIGK